MLIDDIIGLLSSEEGNITDALLKTKVLLHQIGHRELVSWVNDELNGYANESEVPLYRKLKAEVRANLVSMTFRADSHPIPVGHLTEEQRESITSLDARESLASIVELAKGRACVAIFLWRIMESCRADCRKERIFSKHGAN